MGYEPDPWTKARLRARIRPLVAAVNDAEDRRDGCGKYYLATFRCTGCDRPVKAPRPPRSLVLTCKNCGGYLVENLK